MLYSSIDPLYHKDGVDIVTIVYLLRSLSSMLESTGLSLSKAFSLGIECESLALLI